MKSVMTLVALFAAVLSFNASAAVPQTGRVDFSERAGIERPEEVKYHNGRVDPGSTKGIYSHKGRSVTNGRQG